MSNDHTHSNHQDDMEDDSSSDDSPRFCEGMSMTMSMSGFQQGLKGGADCLTYLFRNWKLDERGKFQGAMVYTFLLAILCEYLSHLQGKLRKSTLFIVKMNHGISNQHQIKQQRRLQRIRKFIMTLLYGLSQCLGWSLMLISMTFNVELFLCVVLGTVVGKMGFPTSYGEFYGSGFARRVQHRHDSGENFQTTESTGAGDNDGATPTSQQSRNSSIFRRRNRG
jgi:hypothetical protein